MQDKQQILATFSLKAVLKAMTREALAAVPSGMQVDGIIPIFSWPFRVGRESRVLLVKDKLYRVERPRTGDIKPTNDLYLLDLSELLQISREHFRIEHTVQGHVLSDRGSKCGLTVGGKRVGGNSGVSQAILQDGDVIAIGTPQTPYVYTFMTGFNNSGGNGS